MAVIFPGYETAQSGHMKHAVLGFPVFQALLHTVFSACDLRSVSLLYFIP
jgi:hypothetical protein